MPAAQGTGPLLDSLDPFRDIRPAFDCAEFEVRDCLGPARGELQIRRHNRIIKLLV
jgi:hypothetical protein